MDILHLTGTFGRLDHSELSLAPGLNVLYAPNETGKSTWGAFIRTMLYGLSTRERGPLADKNRYAPWTGAPMQGRMDLTTHGDACTLLRETRRAASPLGEFSCTYTGTGTPVPGITGQNAGEVLLGVPREVFERSAFIGQNALAVDQDAELERRIAALITTGEEDTSRAVTVSAVKLADTGVFSMTEGTVAELTFTVKADAATGASAGFTLEKVAVCDKTFVNDAVKVQTGAAPKVTVGSAVVLGDVNGDGKVNNVDAALVYAYHNKKLTLTEDQLAAADVNGDGKVNNVDAALIYAYHNKKLTKFSAA